MNQNAELDDFDEQRSPGIFARLKGITSHFMPHDEEDEDEEETTTPSLSIPSPDTLRNSGGSTGPLRRNGAALRLDHARKTHVTVRRAMRGFDDARRAADGLKDGQQQIVNLEQTPAEMSERIIDFLNGAAYALDGSVERIGDQVYLFTPASVSIDIEDKAASPRSAFMDQIGS